MSPYGCEHFPGSSGYRALCLAEAARVRETTGDSPFPWSERHLRCVWADAAYRPSPLLTGDGREVIIETPGRWNLEAGPDFLDATLRTMPDQGVFRGDVEIHIRPADWRHHGHASDKRYHNVIAHVTYFEGILADADMPAGILQIPLRQALRRDPAFSFDSLDLPAYPFAALAECPPCAIAMKSLDPDEQIRVLESAGEERLRLKATRLAERGQNGNDHQVFYEEVFGALGYKHNRVPFQKLARLLPLERLQRDAGGNALIAYALLAGIGGLLPSRTQPAWTPEGRTFARSLWDIWWKRQSAWHDKAIHPSEWVLSNIRPANHPLRRLMAAACLFANPSAPPFQTLTGGHAPHQPAVSVWMNTLMALGNDTFWAWHSGLSGSRLTSPCSLVGKGRASAIITNVIVPWQASIRTSPMDRSWIENLPPEDDNRHIRHTAHALFGHDHNPALYRTGLRQQGLLQIFHDFCLDSRNGCAGCELARHLAHQNP